MKYELRLKTNDEVVDTIDFSEGPTPTANNRGAKLYFVAVLAAVMAISLCGVYERR